MKEGTKDVTERTENTEKWKKLRNTGSYTQSLELYMKHGYNTDPYQGSANKRGVYFKQE